MKVIILLVVVLLAAVLVMGVERRYDRPQAERRRYGRPHRPYRIEADVEEFNEEESESTSSINNAGLDLIKSFEGFKSCKYRDPIGLPTIGYGHLIKPGDSFNCISRGEATNLLRSDTRSAESCVRSRVKVPLSSNQFSALTSFAYNVGCGAFSSSTLLRELNNGRYGAVCGQLKQWVKAGGTTLPGLVRRRDAECQLFRN
jgi:lysozyme